MDKPRLGAGRVAFLAHLETIRKELHAGWTMQAVYDTHGQKLGITYSQFTRYVGRFVTGKTTKQSKPEKSSSLSATVLAIPTSEVNEEQLPHRKLALFEATPPPDKELF